MSFLLIPLLLAALCSDSRAQKDSVFQPRGDVTVTDGETVTLDCHYTTSDTNPYMFWYRQAANDKPTLILRLGTYGSPITEDGFKERFQASLDSSSRSVPLKIQSLQLSDSAVYYCALNRARSYSNLVFGDGSRLLVEPRKNYKPSYYSLSGENTKVCLATDFTSYNGTKDVFWNTAEATRPSGDSFFSQVALNSSTNCTEPEKKCDFDIFEPDEKVNFLALVMQGLRLLFIKTVAFNILMMLRVWMSYIQRTDGRHVALSP